MLNLHSTVASVTQTVSMNLSKHLLTMDHYQF